MKWRKFLVGASVAVFLFVLAPVDGNADEMGASQYLVGKAAGSSPGVRLFNPFPVEMCVLVIEYDDNGDFESCEGLIIPAMGTDETGSFSGDGLIQVISVPTAGKQKGRIAKDLGLVGRIRKHSSARALPPRLFKLHSDSGERAAMLAACCTELSNKGAPSNLFAKFAISCS